MAATSSSSWVIATALSGADNDPDDLNIHWKGNVQVLGSPPRRATVMAQICKIS